MATQNAVAMFLLAVDEGGSVLGFSSEDNPEGDAMLRESAARANGTLVRVHMPLPPGSGTATVTVVDA